jgi:hypothetical protein
MTRNANFLEQAIEAVEQLLEELAYYHEYDNRIVSLSEIEIEFQKDSEDDDTTYDVTMADFFNANEIRSLDSAYNQIISIYESKIKELNQEKEKLQTSDDRY